MDLNSVFQYLTRYGSIFIFVIIFLEHLNVPGLAAAVVMPSVGIWCSNSGMNPLFAIALSVAAGIIASWVLYFLGLFCGSLLLERCLRNHPRKKAYIEKKIAYIKEKGNAGVFVSRFIPAVRTFISIPAGFLRMNFLKFSAFSLVAITIYNSAFILAGYFMGEGALHIFS